MPAYFQTLGETIQLTENFLTARPYAYVTNSVRTSATTLLRLRRRPTRYVTLDVPPHYGYLEPGDIFWSSHELLPESATGSDRYQTWPLVPLHIIEIRDRLSPPQLQLKCVDLREVYCSFWSPFLTDIGMTDDLNGIAILDRAGGWRTVRDELAYGERPPALGYCAFQEVLANTPIIDAFGLLIQGGNDVNILLNSVFSEGGPGDTFTSWTKTTSGSAIGVEWPLYTLVDANGFRRSVQLATYNAGENAYLSQTVSITGGYFFAKVYYKNGGAYDDMTIRIHRSDFNEYWRDSDETWQAAVQDNVIAPKTGSTEIYFRWLSKLLNLGGVTTDITVSVGHFSCASAIPQISQLQAVELVSFEFQTGAGYRNLLPTKTAETTRVDNDTFLTNDSAVRVLSPTRGFVKLNFRPLWGNVDLNYGESTQIKYIWDAAFDGVTDTQGFRCYYYRTGASTGVWVLYHKNDNATATLAVSGVVRDQDYTIICRWTSGAQNEHNLTGQALDIWVDGVRGTRYEGATTQTADAICDVYLGSSVAAGSNDYADGHFTYVTMGLHCPTEALLFRL